MNNSNFQKMILCFCTASVLIIVIPLFLMDNSIGAGSLMGTLQTSTLLEKAHFLSLGSVIPLLIDLSFDLFSQTAEISAVAQIKERIIILISLAAFCIPFLCCRNLNSIPAVYVGTNCVRGNIVITMIYYAVWPELFSKLDILTNYVLFVTTSIWLCSNVVVSYSYYFDSELVGVLCNYFQIFLLFSLVYCLTRWFMSIAKRQNTSFVQFRMLTTDEYAALSYATPIVVYGVIQNSTFAAFNEPLWQNRSEKGLFFHVVITYILHMTLILVPGRVLHMLAVTHMNLLRLKQIFVRYVSHEIRSPLNVVHVGLEMLVALIKSADPTSPFVPIDRGTADFIIQMFFSSESAINILNDLLQYEHIEAGTFRLSCEALSLANVLENKFGWANVMASQKGVAFTVTDASLATEFGPLAASLMADEENGLDIVPDEESSLSAQRSLVLYIDIYRIEQVIRNLITNAMKFTPRDGQVSVGISCELFSSGGHAAIRDKFGPDAVGFFRVAVTDSGVGLTEDEQKNIFGEFTQFNKNELQGGGGSGLGLWISRHIVQMHKGVMGVTSAGRGHGSTFFFELPVFGPDFSSPKPPITEATTQQPEQRPQQQLPRPKPASIEARPRLLSPYAVACEGEIEGLHDGFMALNDSVRGSQIFPALEDAAVGPDSVVAMQEGGADRWPALSLETVEHCDTPRPLRLLIVDDSSLNIKVVARLIEGEKVGPFAHATLLTADDGTTAVEQLRTEMAEGRAVHFILMDFIMTDMHGPQAARIMREELNYRGAIIGITGNALPEDIDFFVSSGANQVVTKPLSRTKLLDALCRLVSVAMAAEEEMEE